MLTYQDCLGLSTLTDDEVSAIAEHEHVPQMIAVELGYYLIQREDGVPAIRKIILDDLSRAEMRGDNDHALKLRLVLWHFLATHPDNPARKTL
jgi:hypothetical protein